jgi:hypothetical protein
VKYVQEDHYFIANFSGRMDKRKLAYRAKTLRNCVKCNLKDSKVIKVLLDFREVQWDSEETHYMARKIFGEHSKEFLDYTFFSALLNDHLDGQSSENESLFTNEQDATDWLRSR